MDISLPGALEKLRQVVKPSLWILFLLLVHLLEAELLSF
jgi:hypothetical protein